MIDTDPHIIKLRRTLVILILATLPFYLLGVIILWVGKTAINNTTQTPTAIISIVITATPNPTQTLSEPTLYPTPTHTSIPTSTSTHTPTPTATITQVPTDTLTPRPTDTATLLPASTFTLPPANTEVPPTLPVENTPPPVEATAG